jgi:AcrR family transcriptional regulator
MRVERTRRNFSDESNRYDAKRDRLVLCARKLGEEGNAGKVSVTDVTSEMGITRGLFYYYFGGKDDLNRAIADTYVHDLEISVNKAMDGCESREDAVSSMVEAVFAWLYEEDGGSRPMLHVLAEIGLSDYTWASATDMLAYVIVNHGLLSDYGRHGEEALVERARFVALGIVGEGRLNAGASVDVISDAVCSALRYRKRRQAS